MKSKTQKNFACDPATADDGKVRVGDGAIYFDRPAEQGVKMPSADILDDSAVRLGDGAVYF